MKIAVASIDGVSISRHFGRSRCFIVFDVEGDQVGAETIRANTFSAHAKGECDGEHKHHDEPHSHSDLVAGLEDCSAVLCCGMGWRAAEELAQSGIQPFVVGEDVLPRQAVERYVSGTLQPASTYCRCHE